MMCGCLKEKAGTPHIVRKPSVIQDASRNENLQTFLAKLIKLDINIQIYFIILLQITHIVIV